MGERSRGGVLTPGLTGMDYPGWIFKRGHEAQGGEIQRGLAAQEGGPGTQHKPIKVVLPSAKIW